MFKYFLNRISALRMSTHIIQHNILITSKKQFLPGLQSFPNIKTYFSESYSEFMELQLYKWIALGMNFLLERRSTECYSYSE
jgi:hypothetical protein